MDLYDFAYGQAQSCHISGIQSRYTPADVIGATLSNPQCWRICSLPYRNRPRNG
jgi:hypothetical protein